MNKSYLKIIAFLVLLSGALGVRMFRITESPGSVNWDEAAVGYNAYSLLMTGKDEFGKPFPVSLRSFDDYKPVIYSYMTVPFVKILGLSELSTRLTSVVSGVVLVFLTLYITAKLTGNICLGYLAGMFTAFSPWAMHFSRIAFESNVATTFYYAGIALFVMALKNKRAFIWSILMMILSMYVYHAQRAIAIPTLICLTYVFRDRLVLTVRSNYKKWFGMVILLLIPLAISFLTEPAGNRLSATNMLRLWPFVPKEFSLEIYNPIYTFLWQFTGQFLAYFSPANIFFRGSGEPILRIPGLGLLNREALPFWIAGFLYVKRFKLLTKVLLVLMALTPLPGAITWNWFSVVRTVSLYPIFGIICAIGVWMAYKQLKQTIAKRIFTGVLGTVFFLSTFYSFLTITLYAPWLTYGDFQPGFEKSVPYMLSESEKYSEVIIDSPHIAPYIFVLFYGKYSPARYLQEAGADRENSGTKEYSFGKYSFRKITREDFDKKNILLMGSTDSLPDWAVEMWKKDGKTVRDFEDPMGYISFRVVNL